MKTRTLVCLCGALAAWPLVEASAQAPALTPRDSALHALNRLAYGPRPGEVDRVAADGVMRWVDRQLSPRKIDDGPLAARERRFKILDYDAGELARVYVDAQRERREQKRAAATDSMTEKPEQAGPLEQRGRRLGAEFQELAVIRAVLSERQLYEVMVDFWANHFNVFFAKGADRFLTPSYIEQTIRPRALGKFADLLIATAESPAMLFYLDNWESVAPGATPPQAMRLRARPLFGPRPMFGRPPLFDPGHDPMRADSLRRQALARVPKGINENYARELLELHTLGVDGGYTQQDVIEVARAFTGWTIEDPERVGRFVFRPELHDAGPKRILGDSLPAGRGVEDGEAVLTLLARHPATARFIATKLVRRFVSDTPPASLVKRAARTFRDSGGDIRAVLRTIFSSREFFSRAAYRAKIKSPFELVASALRGLGAAADTTPRTAQLVAQLGEPLYGHDAPNGYPETGRPWLGSGAVLGRINLGLALAAGQAPGVTVSRWLKQVGVEREPYARQVDAIVAELLGGPVPAELRALVQRGDATTTVGLVLGSPDFQRR